MSKNWKPSSDVGAQNAVIDMMGRPWTSVRDDLDAYNAFIANLGLAFKHYIAIPYVIGASETGSLRDYDEAKVELDNGMIVENGFMYKYVGDVFGIFQGNSSNLVQIPAGFYNHATAYVTFNKYYRGTDKQVSLSRFDKLVPIDPPSEFKVVNWQKVEHNPTGIDRLQFKIDQIDYVGDSTGREYILGTDFVIDNGYIKWLPTGSRPGIDPQSQAGRVMSVRYTYRPLYYVNQLMHAVRAHATIDQVTGEVRVQAAPLQAVIQLDFVFLDSIKDGSFVDEAARDNSNTPNTGPR